MHVIRKGNGSVKRRVVLGEAEPLLSLSWASPCRHQVGLEETPSRRDPVACPLPARRWLPGSLPLARSFPVTLLALSSFPGSRAGSGLGRREDVSTSTLPRVSEHSWATGFIPTGASRLPRVHLEGKQKRGPVGRQVATRSSPRENRLLHQQLPHRRNHSGET